MIAGGQNRGGKFYRKLRLRVGYSNICGGDGE